MKSFFIEIPNFWARAGNLGKYIWGHLGYFLISTLVHVFNYSTSISTNNKVFLSNILNICLGLGFEFETQRIKNCSHRVSVVRGQTDD